MKSFKKEKKIKNIQEFDTYKKICQLNKPHSPMTMLFCTNDLPDEWLIDVVEYKTKSGIISETYLITRDDLDRHIKFCGKDGYTILTKY